MNYVYITNQPFPTARVDVDVLFGRKLPALGHRVVAAFQSKEPSAAVRIGWGIGEAWVAGRVAGRFAPRLRNAFLRYWNVTRVLCSLRRGGFDFVQVRDGHLSGLMALAAARLTGLPFVYWMSFRKAEYRLYSAGRARGVRGALEWFGGHVSLAVLHRILLPGAAQVFVQSRRMAEDLADSGVVCRQITPVPMGIDPETTLPVHVEKPEGERWIGYLGTLDRLRTPEILIEAMVRILPTHPDVRLVLVGGAARSHVEPLERRAAELGVTEKVLITGHLPRANALGYVQACDVCLSPYARLPILQSTSPTKLVEYLFLGRPVVASEHPEQREVIEASGCGVCVEHRASAFADAVCALIDDPETRAEMGRRGRDWVLQHRTYDSIAAEVDRSYRDGVGALSASAG